MRYVFALCIVIPLHAQLFETVSLWHDRSRSRISMFGDDHGYELQGYGLSETQQYNHIKDLLRQRSKNRNKKLLHVLLEQPQLFVAPDPHASILQQLSTLARDVPAVTADHIENRATVYAAHTLLKHNDPELVSSVRFDDGTGSQVNLQDVTYGDLFRLFDFRSHQIKNNLKKLNLVGDLFENRLEQAAHFLKQMKKDLKHENCNSKTRIAAMSEVWKHTKSKRRGYFFNINEAFCPLFDLGAVCRTTELFNENEVDVALFAGGDHVCKIAYMLKQRGAYELHRYPSHYGSGRSSALNKQQLDIFDLQPTVWDNGYLSAKQACVTLFNTCCLSNNAY